MGNVWLQAECKKRVVSTTGHVFQEGDIVQFCKIAECFTFFDLYGKGLGNVHGIDEFREHFGPLKPI